MSINKSSAPMGLTDGEVERSRRENGTNALGKRRRRGFVRQFLSAFSDPIIKILCAALAINILFSLRSQGWFETAGIALSIFMASLVSTLSEYGSESAFIRLQEEASRSSARLMRSGRLTECPSDDIVVGDIVLLQAGDRIPADGVLLSGELGGDAAKFSGSEDFANITQVVPSLMVALAAGNTADGYHRPAHHPETRFDEAALPVGAAVYAQMAISGLMR